MKKYNNLTNLIKRSGLTLDKLAIELETTNSFLSMIINGKRNLSLKMAEKCSQFFGVSIEYLYDVDFEERLNKFTKSFLTDYNLSNVEVKDNIIIVKSQNDLTTKESYILEVIRFINNANEKALEKLMPILKRLHDEQVLEEFTEE